MVSNCIIYADPISCALFFFSWDIVIEKVQGIIFLDKRENSSFDLLTVSETAHEPPSASEEFDEINHPDKLSVEATMINQNFSQQVLMDNVDGVRKSVSTDLVLVLLSVCFLDGSFFIGRSSFCVSVCSNYLNCNQLIFAVRAEPFCGGARGRYGGSECGV